MKREDIESDLAQAEIAVARATVNMERQREMLHYATRLGASEIVRLAEALLAKVEDNLVLKMEIRDRLKRALAAMMESEGA
jgi:sugar-specific transcriptional regulator TrmB